MYFNAKTHTISINNTYMDYVVFGKGPKNLVIIPGLSTKNLKGNAILLSFMYRIFTKDYTVYIFDKVYHFDNFYTIKKMSDDIVSAMNILGIKSADVFGISQGGMIAQSLAINNPKLVNKLVLGVTLSRPNTTMTTIIGRWIKYANKNDYIQLNREIFSEMYSKKFQQHNRLIIPLLIHLLKPCDLDKFVISANACISFDMYNELSKITCPVLVLGGANDKIVTGKASIEIAQKLNCQYYLYPNLGHAAYDEAKDFNNRVYNFFQSNE